MVKKIIAAISAMTLSISAFASISSASGYDMSLTTGYNGRVAGTQRCIAVYCEGSAEAYSISTDIYLTVPTGSVTAVALRGSYGLGEKVQEWSDDANDGEGGYVDVWKTLTWEKNIIKDGENGDIDLNDGRDTIKVVAYGTTPYHGQNNMLCEIRLKQADVNNDLDVRLERGSNYQTCNADCSNTQNYKLDTTKKYTVASGTSNVTVKSDEPTKYAVTTADAENGTVTVDKATAAEGETVKITATPADGYEVDTVAVEAADGTSVAVSDNSFVMPAQAVTVKATFKEIPVVDPTAATKLGTYDDGDKDHAVAFTKTFDSAALAGKVAMKLTAVIGGENFEYKNAVAIPNVDDGDLTVGVVIQYGDAAVNVESLAIELQ